MAEAPGKTSPKMGRPSTLAPEWQTLADKMGGVEQLCDELGCSPRTLRHWSSGDRHPGGIAMTQIIRLTVQHGVPMPIFGYHSHRLQGQNAAGRRAYMQEKRNQRDAKERQREAAKAKKAE